MLAYAHDRSPVPGPPLEDGEYARDPRSMAVLAWYDAWGQAATRARPMDYPRRLDAAEAVQWREGWAEGLAERRAHDCHGFDSASCLVHGDGAA